MSKNYVLYHVHSDLSNGVTNIDSINKYYQYIDYAKSLGMKSFGFAEHGCIYEWKHKKDEIEKAGMKYIHAEEFYVTEELSEKIRDNYHCVLIAKNGTGVEELNKLSSIAFEEDHKYYHPRISLKELEETSDNIIITSACVGGILAKGDKAIQKRFLNLLKKNKHRCFLEVQHHNDAFQKKYNQYLKNISDATGIPLIAGTDTHALTKEDLEGRRVLQIGKGVNFGNDENNWDMSFKTYDELVEAYKIQNALPEEVYLQAIENTNIMSDMVEEFRLDYSKKYPKLYDDSEGVLLKKIVEGVKNRGINKLPNYKDYIQRINYELQTYKHNEAIDFLLLEEDYKSYLKKQGVNFGYSRGSVSGSVIAYLLGITEIDSIKYNLNFERFMNTERITLADIDTDWFSEDRGMVRDYLFKRDGLYCCDIITFNTIKMKGAIKDIGRALGMSLSETQEISNAVFLNDNKKFEIDELYRKRYPKLFKYVDLVSGTIVSVGSHPAGLVVSPYPIEGKFGMFRSKTNKNPISQINMKEIDSLNYVKLDVLGLDCVGLIYKTCKLAKIDFLLPENMDFTDMNVWEDLAKDTTLIFQFESDFAGNYLKDILKPEVIEKIREKNPDFSYIDLMSMANGAIRPAGASYRDSLAKGLYRDNGHCALNEFLAPTLGYLVYQEQVIEFLHIFCGYSMGQADVIRRGFAKKTGTEKYIPDIKKGFLKTMKENYGVKENESEELIVNFLKVIEDASSYLFSKNHSDPYSFLGFACGYLRHYYPLETFTAALNIYKSDADKMKNIKNYINQKGYSVNGIRFGYSKAEFYMDKETNSIYQGIESIKYCNVQIAEELFELAKNNYSSFIELLDDMSKTSIDERQTRILIGLNYFSDFGNNVYLEEVYNKYIQLRNAKIISKSKLEKIGISEYYLEKYSKKITPKQYRDIDNLSLLKELSIALEKVCSKPMPVVKQIKFEIENLGYTDYSNSEINNTYYIVIDFVIGNNPTTPRLIIRNLNSGKEIRTRIKRGKKFRDNPFDQFSVLSIKELDKEFKKRPDAEGKWIVTDEVEEILNDYEVIKL